MFPGGPTKHTYDPKAVKRRRDSLFLGGRRKGGSLPTLPKPIGNSRRPLLKQDSYDSYSGDSADHSLGSVHSRERIDTKTRSERILRRDTFADNVARKMLAQFDTKVRHRCNAFAALGAFGMVLAVVLLEISWDHSTMSWKDPGALEWTIKSLLTVSTIVLVLLIFDYYRLQNKAAFSSWYVLDSLTWQKYRYFFLIVEVLVCGIHPIPTFTSTRILPNTLATFMIFRLYLVVRVLRNYCPLYKARKTITSAPHFQSTGSVEFNWVIALRYWFLHYQWSGIVFASIFFLYVFAYGVYVLERLEAAEAWAFETALYQTAVTMTTVGYGDFVPTWAGSRICQSLAAITGILITSLAIFVVVTSLGYTPTERKAHNMLRLYSINESQRRHAATMIQLHWRHFWVNKKLQEALVPTEPDKEALRALRLRNIRLKSKLRRLREEQTLLVADETPELEQEEYEAYLEEQHKDTETRLSNIETKVSTLLRRVDDHQRRTEQQQRVLLAQLNFIVSDLGGKTKKIGSFGKNKDSSDSSSESTSRRNKRKGGNSKKKSKSGSSPKDKKAANGKSPRGILSKGSSPSSSAKKSVSISSPRRSPRKAPPPSSSSASSSSGSGDYSSNYSGYSNYDGSSSY